MSAVALLCLVPAAQADNQAVLDRAMDGALGQLERALPQLDATLFGVNVAAYRDALALRPFSGGSWAGQNVVALTIRAEASGSCSRYAAFVRLPPVDGRVQLVLCPQFFTPGADELRVLTVLHEMVHVVAGRVPGHGRCGSRRTIGQGNLHPGGCLLAGQWLRGHALSPALIGIAAKTGQLPSYDV
ncbi:hypothetical protein [Devosia sp.]|uniref:hypothetical protein n=1 Tax=Devosia sp. TaxID=1871048 RepID=UPI00273686F8|nr:hypothetical protein [Devosia sp.]MDP2781255.1 hypothetical protein [Devosia sp.]